MLASIGSTSAAVLAIERGLNLQRGKRGDSPRSSNGDPGFKIGTVGRIKGQIAVKVLS
jgi:hypothetical protein